MRRRFDRFVLDLEEGVLLDGGMPVPLHQKPLAMLGHLVDHAGRLVTKNDLLDSVWPGIHVSEGVLKTYMYEIRRALDDDAESPRFIETVHGRGYRFLETAVETMPEGAAGSEGRNARPAPAAWPPTSRESRVLVGRDGDLARLDDVLAEARQGVRQVVFVTGEQGIGKTRLVEAFLERAAAASVEATGGQCVETYGLAEPYRPVLEAVGRLCRTGAKAPPARTIALLRRFAPTWLAQLPWLLEAEDRRSLEEEIRGRTRDRMVREIAEFLEAFSAEIPLVLILEDLHWSDVATVELVTSLAERREPARLLVIGTYRPTDLIVSKHVLRAAARELRSRGRSQELALDFLNEGEVSEYLLSISVAKPAPDLVRFLRRQTDGNPLFLVGVVDDLLRRGLVEGASGTLKPGISIEQLALEVPGSLRETIEKQIDRLSAEEQRMLGAASVVGVEFPVAAVAAAVDRPAIEVEEIMNRIAVEGGVVEPAGVQRWPDGTVTERCRFAHALHRNRMLERVGAAARALAHARVGARLETAYGDRAREIAGVLAVHFEEAGDTERALRYLDDAARNATRRHANREAVGLLSRAVDQLRMLPENEERLARELGLEVRLGQARLTVDGYAATEVRRTYDRVRDLRVRVGETTPLAFVALVGIWGFDVVRGELAAARDEARELWRLASTTEIPPQLLGAHYALAFTDFFRGEFAAARRHFREVVELYDPALRQLYSTDTTQDPKASSLVHGAWAAWFLGDDDAARRECHEAVDFARTLGHPFSLLFALGFAAGVEQGRGDVAAVRALTEEQAALSIEYGFPLWWPMGRMLRGWADGQGESPREAVEELRRGLAAYRAAGAEVAVTYYLALLAECEAAAGHRAEALAAIEEGLAIAERRGERFYEAELRRLRGELHDGRSRADRAIARAELEKAATIARSQGAKPLLRRARAGLRGR